MKLSRLWLGRRPRSAGARGFPPQDQAWPRDDGASGTADGTAAPQSIDPPAGAPDIAEPPTTRPSAEKPRVIDEAAPPPSVGQEQLEDGPPGARRRRLSTRERKRLLYAATAVVVAVLLWLWLRPSPVQVEAEPVTRGPLEATIDEEGTTRVQERFIIAAPVAGRLQRPVVEEGDMVTPGQVVARLAPVPLDATGMAQARARLQAAEAQRDAALARAQQTLNTLEQTRRQTARTQVLAEAGAESRERREIAETALQNADREHAAAREAVTTAAADVDAARGALVNTSPVATGEGGMVPVSAPSGGRVLRVLEPSDRVVTPGTPLLEIGDARALEAVVDVLSRDAVRVAPGAPVIIEEWGGETPLEGSVARVEPSAFTRVSALGVEEQRVNVIVALPGAPASLGDGFRVEARVVVWSESDALRVPLGALFRQGEGWAVFVAERGRARARQVEIGERDASYAEVRGGLTEGETVVVYPPDRLEDGDRIRLP